MGMWVEGAPGMEEGSLGQDLDERIHERDPSVVVVAGAEVVDWNSAPVGKIALGDGQAELCWARSTICRNSTKSNDEIVLEFLEKRNPHFVSAGNTSIRALRPIADDKF
jgi:hypothetical protein